MAEGAYNATLALLGDPTDMVDYGMPLGSPNNSKYPVLWESVVGHDDIWPIKVDFDVLDGSQVVEPGRISSIEKIAAARAVQTVYSRNVAASLLGNVAPVRIGREIYPLSFQFAFVALNILCVIASITLICPRPTTSLRKVDVPGWLRQILREPCDPTLIQERRLLLATVAFALLTAYLIFAGAALTPIVVGDAIRQPLGVTSKVAIESAVMLVILLTTGALVATLRDLADAGRPLIATLIFAFALFEFGLVVIEPQSQQQNLAGELFTFLRAANLGDGVSELFPLAFAGMASFILLACHLDRLRLLEDCSTRSDNMRPIASFLGFGTESFVGIESYQRQITKLLECHTLELPSAREVLVGLLVGLLYYVGRYWLLDGDPFRAIDGWQFYYLFALISTAVYGFFTLLVLRFFVVWAAVDRLLKYLYWHPSRTGYEELRRRLLPGRPEDQRISVFEPPPSRTAVEGALQHARTLLHRANDLVRNPPAFPLRSAIAYRDA